MTVKETSELAGLGPAACALAQDNSTPDAYLDSLEKQELYQDAIRFLAYKLSTNNGIKWANKCFRELASPEQKQKKDEALEASEKWVAAPADPARWAAKQAADKATTPSKLVALAVFMSGGSIVQPGAPEIQPPPYTAQKMIAGSVQIAIVGYDPQKLNERYKQALKMGRELDGPA